MKLSRDQARRVGHALRAAPCFLKAALRGEPTFTLRAQDGLAPATIEGWAGRLEQQADQLAQTDPARVPMRRKATEARGIAARMRDWQRRHGAKLPD